MTKNSYDAADLARGAYYAYEQAGLLLRDARALFKQKRYSSAAVLAIFASEELGRARIYLECRKKVLPAGSVSKQDLELACRDHEVKLAKGQVLIGFRAPRENLSTDEIFEIARRVKKRVPGQRHKQRIRSLYVDPDDCANGWNRPRDMSRLECQVLVISVLNDYSLFPEYHVWPDSGLQTFLESWKHRPKLPRPKW